MSDVTVPADDAAAQTTPESAPTPRPPVLTAGQPFIPPRPATPAAQEPQMRAPQVAPNAFAEAAIENGSAQTEKRRGRSLFQKVTGAVNSLVSEEEHAAVTPPPVAEPAREEPPQAAPASGLAPPTPEPAASPAPAAAPAARPVSQEPAPETAPPAPTQPSLTNLEPGSRTEPASDDDTLEIPAFLRRQAN
jgi:hypothetical protein